MRERRDKGLCYNCDDKWNPAHKYKTPKLFLIHGLELPTKEIFEEIYYDSKDSMEHSPPATALATIPTTIEPKISLNAISGSLSPRTMRLEGLVKNQRVVILIDSGSTYNFLDPSILKKIHVGVLQNQQLQVKIANGAKIWSEGRCNSLSIKVQGTTITSDFYVLTLGGCDIVLGVTWLRTLGPIIWDFLLMTMQYGSHGKSIVLTGLNPTGLTLEKGHKFLKASNSGNRGIWLQLIAPETHSCPLDRHAPIQKLLDEFSSVFDEPIGLPPIRSHDHQIILKRESTYHCSSTSIPIFSKNLD
jgi:hypothetical protein